MADDPLDAVAAAVADVMRDVAGVEAVAAGRRRADPADRLGDVAVAVRLTAGRPGWLALGLPAATAEAVARRVLAAAGHPAPDDGLVRDCAGELLNVIAGQAKARLAGTPAQFTFGTPVAVADGDPGVPADRAVIEFASEVGRFAVHLAPPPAGVAGGGPAAGPGG